MLPAQRQDRILTEIERAGGARIVQLAELLGVSDMTVRRDIDVLAARGLVIKVYGGATVRPQGTSDEPGFESHLCCAVKPDRGPPPLGTISQSLKILMISHLRELRWRPIAGGRQQNRRTFRRRVGRIY
jgi:DNA-binding Lrp family transcriptional regulator